jgi:phage-related protein
MATVDELTTILGVKLASGSLESIQALAAGMDRVATLVKGAAAAFGLFKMGQFINDAAAGAAELDKMSRATGRSTDSIQEWRYMATAAGVDANAVSSNLNALQSTLNKDMFGVAAAKMSFWGVATRDVNGKLKTSDQMLSAVADKVAGMSEQRARQWASQVGINDDTLLLLKQGSAGLEELKKKAHDMGAIIPADSIKLAAQFKRSLGELQFTLNNLTQRIALSAIPTMNKFLDGFKNWIAVNREWIQQKLQAVIEGVSMGFERFMNILDRVAQFFRPLTDNLKKLKPPMKDAELFARLLSGALLGLLLVILPAALPIMAMTAAVLAAGMAFDDLMTFIEGGDSILGRLLGTLGITRDDVMSLVESFKNAVGAVKDFVVEHSRLFLALGKGIAIVAALSGGLALLAGGFGILKTAVMMLFNVATTANPFMLMLKLAIVAVTLIIEYWEDIVAFFRKLWADVKETFPNFAEWAENAVEGVKKIWNRLVEWFKGLWLTITEGIPDVGKMVEDKWNNFKGGVKSFFGIDSAASPSASVPDSVPVRQSGGARQTTNTMNQTNNFNMPPQPDAPATANAVANILQTVAPGGAAANGGT